ncbi:MAG: homoserine O-acetyltransferase [Cellvibrionales bacterium]|nr:homoserine O-acetyltransferase [Cellvibrionales bacterium]
MPRVFPADSVGLVKPQTMQIEQPLQLACGQQMDGYRLVYETYGRLNADKTNAVLVCHALSGHHHAAGYHSDDPREKPGWWEACIGPGKPLDTRRFYVVVPNNIGGCHGSSGPNTRNPATGRYWGPDFPPLRFRDWVQSQRQLADRLGIDCWAAIVGGSLGGMQAMRWALEYPERLRHAVVIASAMALTPLNIAFNALARQAITADPAFCGGRYLDQGGARPDVGLALARMTAQVTYLSDSAFAQRFGRALRQGSFARGQVSELQFEVESYLDYKGKQFSADFDANSYLLILRMLDFFDLAREYDDDPVAAFSHALCKFLVISFSSDWRFLPERSREITRALIAAGRDVSHLEIATDRGHDAFLLPLPRYIDAFAAYMRNVGDEISQ